MKNYTVRHYQTDHDVYAMQAMNAQSIAEAGLCGYLHIGDIPHRIFNGLRRENPQELVWLWRNTQGELVGFVMTYPGVNGFDMVVHHAHRAGDLEADMIAHSIEQCRIQMEKRDQKVEIGTDVDACDSIRIDVLTNAGFEKRDHLYWLTERDLSLPIPDPVLPQGYTIRSAAGIHEAQKLIDVHSSGFGSNWTLAQYERVMTSPGYSTERELVVVAPDGQFAAFCIIWLDDINKIGYFEPVGVHKAFHRKGLGTALMRYGMQVMVAQGMALATVLHGVDNLASTGLYASLGFKQTHPIYDYQLNPQTKDRPE